MSSKRRPEDEGRLLQLVFYAYVAGSRLALALPERFAYAAAHGAGSLWARLGSKKRALVTRNMARMTGLPEDSPRVRNLVVAAFKSYARYWLETFRFVREGREFWLTRFICPDEHKIDTALARGKGVIVVVGHLGNWDAAGAWVGARGNLLVAVAEVLRPRRMFEFFAEHRARLGMVIHPAEAGVTTKLVEEVQAGAVVAILGDRDLKGTGPEVNFFGEPATLPAGAASVALRAGVPVLVAGVYGIELADGRRGWKADISDPIPMADLGPAGDDDAARGELTRRIGAELERCVARHPEEWHVFQPFWIADRKKR